jgi:hypothetical protein
MDCINVNVGGIVYVTNIHKLSEKSELIRDLLSNNNSNEIFIDRCPYTFNKILNIIRGYKYNSCEFSNTLLLQDIQYYKIKFDDIIIDDPILKSTTLKRYINYFGIQCKYCNTFNNIYKTRSVKSVCVQCVCKGITSCANEQSIYGLCLDCVNIINDVLSCITNNVPNPHIKSIKYYDFTNIEHKTSNIQKLLKINKLSILLLMHQLNVHKQDIIKYLEYIMSFCDIESYPNKSMKFDLW